jgi:M6 family metalloprotease-like protein
VKHNDKITPKDWENEFFSRKLYASTSATGQQVYGSVNDFYIEQSSGTMRVEGKMLGWLEVAKNRMDYSPTPMPPATPNGGDKKPVPEKKVFAEADDRRVDKIAVEKPAPGKPPEKPTADKPAAAKPNADKARPDKPGPEKGAGEKPGPDENANRRGNKDALLREVLDKLTARDGKDALSRYDVVVFI